MTDPTPTRRFSPTPAWLIFGLLVVEGLLWLSERYQWFWFNERKGWTVLIAMAVVGLAVILMLLWFITSLLFRSRFQFSIRSLLVLVVAVALPCSWLAVKMKAAREQKRTIEMLMSSGCNVFYGSIDERGNLDLTKSMPSLYCQEWLDDLLGWDFFVTATYAVVVKHGIQESPFYVYKHHTHDEVEVVLLALRNLPDLRFLDLSGMPINDGDLENLVPLTELRHLDLVSTQVNDAGLDILNAWPNSKSCCSTTPKSRTLG